MLPVRHAWGNKLPEVLENALHGLGLLRRASGEGGQEVSWLRLRAHRELLYGLEVVRNPVRHLVGVAAEFPSVEAISHR